MKIAIAGYGLEGEANYNYWSQDPANELTIVDENESPKYALPEGANTLLGAGVFERLDGFDLVIRTAGLSPYKIKTDGKIWSASNEFFAKCPARIIGVTGTKGKGTTSSLIAAILTSSGYTVHLVGNIGKSALAELPQIQPDDIVVYELSSFQLWDLERSPHTGLVLIIEPEHLDVHRDYQDYITAKSQISAHQKAGETTYYRPNDHDSEWIANAGTRASGGVVFATPFISTTGVHVADGQFWNGEQLICSTDALQLVGQHNIENACAAITVSLDYEKVTPASITEGLRGFQGLPHRIEFVRTLEDVSYYNDSFSSSVPATIAAVKSFTQPEIVIIGGVDRGGDFGHLIADLSVRANIKEVVLIGQIRDKLFDLFKAIESPFVVTKLDAQTMPEVVDYCREFASAGDVIILSPGCASFDMFKDFYDRGDQFREYVNSL